MALSVKDGAGLITALLSRLVGSDHVVAHDSIPFATPDLTWLVDQTMAADKNYDSVDCQRFSTVWLEFIMATTAEGDLFIEYSMDDTTFYPFVMDAGKFSTVDPGSKLTVTEAEGKIAVATLAAETRISMGVEKPPPFMRARWDFIAGASDGMDATNFGRG